jgi:RND family efflux transporter MFP subunit
MLCTLGLIGSTPGSADSPAVLPLGPFHGVIRPTVTVPLGIPVEGRLAEVLVEPGDTVRAGQPLAALESAVEELDLALARVRAARVSELDAARVRIEDISQSLAARQNLTGIIAEEELRSLRTDQRLAEIALVEAEERQRIAELEVERASARLALRRILSPFDGIVTERHLSPGELVDSGKPVLTVAQIDPLSIDSYLPVEFLDRIAVGDEAEVTPEIPGQLVIVARVERIDAIVDPASHTFGVRLTVENAAKRVPAGVRCRVRFGQ